MGSARSLPNTAVLGRGQMAGSAACKWSQAAALLRSPPFLPSFLKSFIYLLENPYYKDRDPLSLVHPQVSAVAVSLKAGAQTFLWMACIGAGANLLGHHLLLSWEH